MLTLNYNFLTYNLNIILNFNFVIKSKILQNVTFVDLHLLVVQRNTPA